MSHLNQRTLKYGDLVGYCTYANDVIDMPRRYNILTIMGNYDDAVGNVTDNNKRYLRELPKEMLLKFEGKTINFVHGSPRKTNEYLKESTKVA